MDTYISAGLAAPGRKSIMAHCVYSDEREIRMMKDNDTYAIHCPQCNMNIASGIAPVRKWLDIGVHMGLGSDVAGGATLSIFRTMMEARQVSKLVWRLLDQNLKPLTWKKSSGWEQKAAAVSSAMSAASNRDTNLTPLSLMRAVYRIRRPSPSDSG